ncbi:hypothetical protein [Priestia aryabhattai]
MGLYFKNYKNHKQNQHLDMLLSSVKQNPRLFINIARVFDIVRDNEDTEYLETIMSTQLNPSLLGLTSDEVSHLKDIIRNIYQHKKFSDLKGDFLEQVVGSFGPLQATTSNYFIEPEIYDDTVKIGETNSNCDIVFYESDECPLEIIECKSNITNVIPANQPFEYMKESHQKKVRYMDSVRNHLVEKYKEPNIAFACYNQNFSIYKDTIQNKWGYKYIELIGPMDIIKSQVS